MHGQDFSNSARTHGGTLHICQSQCRLDHTARLIAASLKVHDLTNIVALSVGALEETLSQCRRGFCRHVPDAWRTWHGQLTHIRD